MPITDPGQEFFQNGAWGWNGTEWIKLGSVWSYHAIYGEETEDLNADAGSNTLNGTNVPAGEVWVVQAAMARNKNTDPALVTVQGFVNSQSLVLVQTATPGVAAWVFWTGTLTLGVGDRVYASITGCTAGDDIELRVCGYKMKVG